MNDEIKYRCELRPGDLGWVIHRHGAIYAAEHGYGIEFEVYVAEGLAEFRRSYDATRDRVWIAECDSRIVGFMLAMHRGDSSVQLRYFYLEPEFRGSGIGKRMMEEFADFVRSHGFSSAFLWTTNEQTSAASLYLRFGFREIERKFSTAFGKPLFEVKYELTVE